jgi:excinuclease UvrABC nuclease subunit
MAYFNPNKWLTPNTYDPNFADPKGRGVYLLAQRIVLYEKRKVKFKILYVGMSLNLRQRLTRHEVLMELKGRFDDVVIFFQNHAGNLRNLERHFIHSLNPPYNTIGRRRGL